MLTIGGLADDSATAAVDTLSDDNVEALLSDLGISAVGRKSLEKGETLFTLEAHNRQVGVVHNARYKQLQFVVLYGGDEDVTIEKVRQANRWNRTQRLSRAVVLDGGTWAIARDFNYRHSATRQAISSAFRQFVSTLPLFRTFVESGNVPEADHTRGPSGSVSPERVEQALQQAGAESVDLIEANGDVLTSFARFGTIAVSVTHDQRTPILSLRYSYRAESESLDEVLRRCNAWNDEPSLGRASSNETLASGTAHALWQLDDDLALTMETTQPAIEGFVREFISTVKTFREFAQDDQRSPPDLAARFEPGGSESATQDEHVVSESDLKAAADLKVLWSSVLEFRNACAMQGSSAFRDYASATLAPRVAELGQQAWGKQVDVGWSYFFSRALFSLGRPTSQKPVVGFYHPWSDVWILTEWQVVSGKARIIDLELMTGEWLRRRGEPPFDLRPEWLRRDGNRIEQLVRATTDNVRDFEVATVAATPWKQTLKLADRDAELTDLDQAAAAMQLIDSLARVFELDSPQPKEPVVKALQQQIAEFRTRGANGQIGELLARANKTEPDMADIIRGIRPADFPEFQPQYWMADKTQALVFLVPDKNPDFFLALTFSREADDLRLARMDLFHFPTMFEVLKGGKAVESTQEDAK